MIMTDTVEVAIISAIAAVIVSLITGIFMKLGHVEKNVNGNLRGMTEELKANRLELASVKEVLAYNHGFTDGSKQERDKTT
jgi:hypothetical protein